MIYSLLGGLFGILTGPGLIIALIYFFRKKSKGPDNQSPQFQMVSSQEDAMRQWYFLLSVLFLSITLAKVSRDFDDILRWQTITLISSLVSLLIAYYFRVVSVAIIGVLGIVAWWLIESAAWLEPGEVKSATVFTCGMLISILLYILGNYHEKSTKYKSFAPIYLVFGILPVTVSLFVLSSQTGLWSLSYMTKGASIINSWQMTLSFALFAVSIIFLTLNATLKKTMLVYEAAAVIALAILFTLPSFLPAKSLFIETSSRYFAHSGSANQLSTYGEFWAVIYNIITFFELLGIIFLGYAKKEEWFVNLGTAALFVLIIFKYFDWFFSFLDKSLFFIGAGIILFIVGWFMEKSRRYLISNIKTEEHKPKL